jgi:hypothetical protein
MPGVPIGIDATGAVAEVAMAVGGNAVILPDREGFERDVPVPPAPEGDWVALFEGARLRAERALARPVTHAAIAVDSRAGKGDRMIEAAASAGLALVRIVDVSVLDGSAPPACAMAVLAEDIAPRPEGA